MGELSRFNSLFDDAFLNRFFVPVTASGDDKVPAIDIHESDTGYCIKADLPGVKKEDVQVNLEHGLLTIKAETKTEDKEEKEGKIIRQERHFGQFVRRLSVGDSVDPDKITAKFDNGVLEVNLPKPDPGAAKTANVKVE
ncbi:Hsp20/alpha crystallin family protein [Neptuniibacter sp. QD37_6]|uniref:Hsp20/alpha crystallin family protein n=1 Tax=Neptuniibacter sp. QD37_6 TaxID=3398210 RepID=UPI0039F46629